MKRLFSAFVSAVSKPVNKQKNQEMEYFLEHFFLNSSHGTYAIAYKKSIFFVIFLFIILPSSKIKFLCLWHNFNEFFNNLYEISAL